MNQNHKRQGVTPANFLMRVSRGFHVTGTLAKYCVSQKQKPKEDITLANFILRGSRGFHVTRTLLESCVSEKPPFQGLFQPLGVLLGNMGQSGAPWCAWTRIDMAHAGFEKCTLQFDVSHGSIDIFLAGKVARGYR